MNNTKILIVGPAWVGDMVMAQVLFKLLRAHAPSAEIHVLAPAWTHPLLSRMPEVNHAIELPFSHGQLQLFKRYQFAKTLRSMGYDQAIVLPNSWKSALIPFWAKIPVRTGFVGECRYGLLNDARVLDKKRLTKMVDRFAALAYPALTEIPANLPIPSLQVLQVQVESVCEKYHVKKDHPILALCPGAEFGPSKCWPANYYTEVANHYLSKGYAVWLFGSKKDCAITDVIQVQTQNRCENLAGETTLADAIDLLSLANVVITNDSGLMHVACALDRRVIALYGSTSENFTPSLSARATILKLNLDCQPCFQRECPLKHHHCMTQLLPERVCELL